MVWLFAIVIVILLIFSAQFRKLSLWIAALLVVVGAISYMNEKQEKGAARSRIPFSQLGFENVTLKPEYDSYKLLGRIKNNSPKFTLKHVELVITMQDCPTETDSHNCITIGEETEHIFEEVPPSQARDFDKSLYFSGSQLKPKGRLAWNYTVSQTEGK